MNIAKFENSFKSILAYHILIEYNIINETTFDCFITDLYRNTGRTAKEIARFDLIFGNHYRDQCKSSFGKYKNKIINDYRDNIFVFFDNLSIGETTKIYNCCKSSVSKMIYNDLKAINLTFNCSNYRLLGQKLLLVVGIRNKVYHCGSLEIYKRFHDIKTKEIRDETGPFSQEAIRI